MKRYKISNGWAIVFYIGTSLISMLFTWLTITIYLPSIIENASLQYWFLTLLSIGIIGFMLTALLETAKATVAIDNEKVSIHGVFLRKELRFEEIKGYKIDSNYIIIEPNSPLKKKIKISYYFGNTREIIEWLANNYPDLDELNAEQELKEIVENEEFGKSEIERKVKLNNARKTARVLNWSGGLIGIWTIFWAEPYEYSILSSIAITIISIIALIFSNGLIRFDDRKGAVFPSVAFAIGSTSLGLGFRAILDFTILEYTNAWAVAILITVVLVTLITLKTKEYMFRNVQEYFEYLAFIVIMFCYSFSTVIIINCYYDNSKSEKISAVIIDKYESSSDGPTYNFKVTTWEKLHEISEVTVSKSLYDKRKKGDKITINVKKGKLNIPWYDIEE